jgi:hypothetical protein
MIWPKVNLSFVFKLDLTFLQDRMDLQDALRSCKWRVDLSVEKLKSDMQSLNQAEKKTSLLPKKKSNNFSLFYNKRFIYPKKSVNTNNCV